MTRTAAVVLALLSISACSKAPASPQGARQETPQGKAVADRCARGGMEAANDPTCKAAADDRFSKFLDGGSDEHRRR